MRDIVYIGIDDTDVIGSPGTGHLSRGLAKHLEELGLGTSMGITRHQLLVDDRIRYTSHNSSLCIALATEQPIENLYQPCCDFLNSNFIEGSDPGLCICRRGQLNDKLMGFGLKARTTVLDMQDASALARKNNLFLVELGGSGEGIVGALAAVALRVEGNSGRFIELRGIRDIKGFVSVSEILELTDIDAVQDAEGGLLDDGAIIDSLDWIRPSLLCDMPVLRVKLESNDSDKRVWFSMESRQHKNRKEALKQNE